MATSSIFANFDITEPKKARDFVEALEKSAKSHPDKRSSKKTLVTNKQQIKELFQTLSNTD